ncbi:ParB/RepB/Spo0J family partition protein [uncultured Oscillibacter sp.]|uniref:ParB/RepB/Spo0J family partition protein n=1 Tax=uncultured Oscillibacter sp. TaxID=876091 RepID=UPI00261549D8|nr:ParB/RepB/Spo0J family partition protein [uncultured Oscillibacter sp.]
MAGEEKNTGQGEQITLDVPGASSVPDLTNGGPPAPELGDVVVDTAKIDELMAKRNAAARAAVEQAEDAPALTGEGDKAAEAPASDKEGEDHREPWEKTQAELDEEKKKPRRGRPPKDKTEPEADKPKRRGRPPKAEKSSSEQAKGQRDKVSRSKKDKGVPSQAAVGGSGGPGSAPASEAPAEPTPPPRPVEEGKLVYLKLSKVHPFHTFRPHPFKVKDDAKMQETVSSIKANGVMVPGLARPEKDGNGYELIAGHRRHRGSELAGLEEMPFIVRDMSDHEAVQAMKDSNKQRDQTLPSELAALLDLEVEDIKHQGGRLKGVAEGDVGKRSVEIVGEAHDMNYKKVMRYLRLNSLVPELLDMVDDKKMGFMPAVELSYIREKNQRLIAVSIEGEQSSPSVAQAKRLRELDQAGKLTGDIIDGILSEEKKEVDRVIITTDELNKYFGKEVTPRQMKDQIMALLDDWKEKQPPALDKPHQDR